MFSPTQYVITDKASSMSKYEHEKIRKYIETSQKS